MQSFLGMGVFGFLKVPFRIIQKAWSHVLPSNDTRTVLALPVAGLDEAIAHQIVSTLRSAAGNDEVSVSHTLLYETPAEQSPSRAASACICTGHSCLK